MGEAYRVVPFSRMRLNRRAAPADFLADAGERLTVTVVAAALAGCAVSGAPLTECEGSGASEREPVIVRPPAAADEVRPLTIDCWREVGRERLELWFSYPAGAGCWVLSSAVLRESADAISITLAAIPAPVCADGAGSGMLTQIELQAPVDDRAVLDGGGA